MKSQGNKIATKPKTYSVDDIYAFYITNLLKERPHYTIKGLSREGKITRFSSIYHFFDKELTYIENQLRINKDRLKDLESDVEDKPNLVNDISDIKIAINSLELRKGEIISKTREKRKIIDYKQFKEILTVYHKLAEEAIINGKKLNLLNGLGYISGKRIERNPENNKSVNWAETDKLRDENGNLPLDKNGKKVIVYYTDDDFCRVAWTKTSGIKNISVYSFVPSGGQPGKGFRQKFSKALIDNPVLQLNFDFFPFRYDKKELKEKHNGI